MFVFTKRWSICEIKIHMRALKILKPLILHLLFRQFIHTLVIVIGHELILDDRLDPSSVSRVHI